MPEELSDDRDDQFRRLGGQWPDERSRQTRDRRAAVAIYADPAETTNGRRS